MECIIKSCHSKNSFLRKMMLDTMGNTDIWGEEMGYKDTEMTVVYPKKDDSNERFYFKGHENITRKYKTSGDSKTIRITINGDGAITNKINITGNGNTVNIFVYGDGTTNQKFNIKGNHNTLEVTFKGSGSITQSFKVSGKGNTINSSIITYRTNVITNKTFDAIKGGGFMNQKFKISGKNHTINQTVQRYIHNILFQTTLNTEGVAFMGDGTMSLELIVSGSHKFNSRFDTNRKNNVCNCSFGLNAKQDCVPARVLSVDSSTIEENSNRAGISRHSNERLSS